MSKNKDYTIGVFGRKEQEMFGWESLDTEGDVNWTSKNGKQFVFTWSSPQVLNEYNFSTDKEFLKMELREWARNVKDHSLIGTNRFEKLCQLTGIEKPPRKIVVLGGGSIIDTSMMVKGWNRTRLRW